MEKYNLWPANCYHHHHHHHLVAVGTCICSYRDVLQAYYYPHKSAVLKSLKKYDSNKGEIGALAEPLNEQTTPKWIARESFSVNYESQKSLKKTAPPRDVETLRRVWEMCSQGEKMHPWLNNIIFFVLKNAEVTKVPTLLIWIWKHIATQFREMKFRCFVPFKKRRTHTV